MLLYTIHIYNTTASRVSFRCWITRRLSTLVEYKIELLIIEHRRVRFERRRQRSPCRQTHWVQWVRAQQNGISQNKTQRQRRNTSPPEATKRRSFGQVARQTIYRVAPFVCWCAVQCMYTFSNGSASFQKHAGRN